MVTTLNPSTRLTNMANLLQTLFNGRLPERRPESAPIGSGMAGMASNAILRQQYNNYVQNAQIEGGEVMPFDQWVASRGTQNAM